MDERMSVFTRFFILAILSIFVIIIKKKLRRTIPHGVTLINTLFTVCSVKENIS